MGVPTPFDDLPKIQTQSKVLSFYTFPINNLTAPDYIFLRAPNDRRVWLHETQHPLLLPSSTSRSRASNI